MAERILIVRLGSMGDVLHALPAVALLRQAFPTAKIGWVIEQRWMPLLVAEGAARIGPRGPERPLVDAVHVVDTMGWRRALLAEETWAEVRNAVRELRAGRYELAIDFQGAWKSAILAQLSRAETCVGFAEPREKPVTMFYSEQVQAAGQHVVEQNLSLARAVMRQSPRPSQTQAWTGHPTIQFPLPYDEPAEVVAAGALLRYGIEQFVIINPGAGWGAKQWPAERYAEVAQGLAARGLRAIINFGPGEEALARQVEAASQGSATAIPATVAELIAFTRRARLFVGGDTGPMHLAAALGVPVVALFGPTDPARNGPYAANSMVLRSAASVTERSHRPEPDPGLLTITAAEVLAAAEKLLAEAA